MNNPYDRPLSGNRCQCSVCFEYFNSEKAFTRHRVGSYMPMERRCLTVDEMLERGFSKNKADFWITEAFDRKRVGTRLRAAIRPNLAKGA